MGIWFSQKVTAIGQPEDLAKIINVNLKELEGIFLNIERLDLSAGMTDSPPFPLLKMSKQHRNVIFASSIMVEVDSFYRFLLLDGQYREILVMPYIKSDMDKIESHNAWTIRLEYNNILNEYFPNYYDDTPNITVTPINYA